MNIQMIGDNVLVKLPKILERKIGSIIIPEIAFDYLGEHYRMGIIYGIGPGKKIKKTGKLRPLDNFQVGDSVFIPKFSGVRILIDDDEFVVVNATDIFGVFEE